MESSYKAIMATNRCPSPVADADREVRVGPVSLAQSIDMWTPIRGIMSWPVDLCLPLKLSFVRFVWRKNSGLPEAMLAPKTGHRSNRRK